ncbi:hypothetical protein JCM1840_006386 [Sporobolomyces johnsonii]
MSHSPSLAPPTRDPRRRPGSTNTGTSTSASAVGPPEPRASKIAREAREAAQPYRRQPDPPSSRHPTDSNQLCAPLFLYGRRGRGAGKLTPIIAEQSMALQWLPKQQFTEAQVQKVSGRGKRKQWSRPVKYAKCQRCIVPQQLEIKCDSCNHVLSNLCFSEAMRAKAGGATCRGCQKAQRDPKDKAKLVVRGPLITSVTDPDPFPAALAHSLEERVFGSSDDEPDDETLEELHEAKIAPGGGYGDDGGFDDYDA